MPGLPGIPSLGDEQTPNWICTGRKTFAESEFEKYRVIQDRLFESDFDRVLKQIPKKGELP